VHHPFETLNPALILHNAIGLEYSQNKGPQTITEYSPAFGNVPHPWGFAKVLTLHLLSLFHIL